MDCLWRSIRAYTGSRLLCDVKLGDVADLHFGDPMDGRIVMIIVVRIGSQDRKLSMDGRIGSCQWMAGK